MLVLHGLRCPSAESKTRKAQFSRTQCFDALNYPEKYRYRVLCSEYVGILQPGEEDIVAKKMIGKSQMALYDCSSACDSSLECCIASTINSNVKASTTDLSTVFG
jgi:hypothetical protein